MTTAKKRHLKTTICRLGVVTILRLSHLVRNQQSWQSTLRLHWYARHWIK